MKPGSGDRGPGSGGRSEAHELRLGDHEGADETVKRTSAGKAYWRSLDDLADTPEFRALVEKEFPGLAEELLSPRTRRAFLKVMGASLGVAGLAACRWPKETILPFAHRPEDRIPGVPQQYATAMELAGAAVGLLVTSYDGRPVKIEGNPLHPTSRGAASALAQASLLELYDPDRSQQVVRRDGGQAFPSAWDEFAAFAGPHFAALRAKNGARLTVLSEESSSPSLARLRQRFAELFPEAKWASWEAIPRDDGRPAAARLFGEPLRPLLRFDRADVVLCLDADPILDHPAALAYARDFAARRRGEGGTMSRVSPAGAVMSLTAAASDHRLAVASSRVAGVAARVLVELGRLGVPATPGGEFARLATADPGRPRSRRRSRRTWRRPGAAAWSSRVRARRSRTTSRRRSTSPSATSGRRSPTFATGSRRRRPARMGSTRSSPRSTGAAPTPCWSWAATRRTPPRRRSVFSSATGGSRRGST